LTTTLLVWSHCNSHWLQHC